MKPDERLAPIHVIAVRASFVLAVELEDFPFDVQDLTMSLAFNTRTKGMMPLKIVTSPDLRTSIAEEGFVDGKMWNCMHQALPMLPFTMPQLCLFSARAHFTLSDAISAVHTELDVKPGTVGAT